MPPFYLLAPLLLYCLTQVWTGGYTRDGLRCWQNLSYAERQTLKAPPSGQTFGRPLKYSRTWFAPPDMEPERALGGACWYFKKLLCSLGTLNGQWLRVKSRNEGLKTGFSFFSDLLRRFCFNVDTKKLLMKNTICLRSCQSQNTAIGAKVSQRWNLQDR